MKPERTGPTVQLTRTARGTWAVEILDPSQPEGMPREVRRVHEGGSRVKAVTIVDFLRSLRAWPLRIIWQDAG